MRDYNDDKRVERESRGIAKHREGKVRATKKAKARPSIGVGEKRRERQRFKRIDERYRGRVARERGKGKSTELGE